MNEILTGPVCLICLGRFVPCVSGVPWGWEERSEKAKGEKPSFLFPQPPDSKTSSPLTPKEGLFLRLDALCWISLIVAYSPRNGSLDCQSLQNFRLWCCPNTVLCVHYRKLYSTVAHRDKTLPRIQNTSQNLSVLDSGKYFGFLGVFLVFGACFEFLEVFLDSGTCFEFWEVFCPYEPP